MCSDLVLLTGERGQLVAAGIEVAAPFDDVSDDGGCSLERQPL